MRYFGTEIRTRGHFDLVYNAVWKDLHNGEDFLTITVKECYNNYTPNIPRSIRT